MVRLLTAGFLIAHGLIHAAIYAPPKPQTEQPFDPAHSWALSAAHVGIPSMRAISVNFSWAVAALFAASGIALLASAEVWIPLALAGAGTGVILKGLYFNRWLSAGVLLDVAVMAAVTAEWPGDLF